MYNYQNNLSNKIRTRSLKIGIIGIGYVGIKLVLAFAKESNTIYCFDNDKNKINFLKKNKSPYSYINDKEIKRRKKFLNLENKLHNIKNCDVIIFCLPTPLKNQKPDISSLKDGWNKIKKFLRPGQLIVLESTVYPGCTEDIFLNDLQKKFDLEKNFYLAYSPERENPGDKKYGFKNTPKVVSGYDKISLKITKNLYKIIVNKVVTTPNIKIAETSKLLENIYRSVNIALINELKIACDNLNIDLYKVIDVASTKPFGFQKFAPGPGTGGHCIPIDPIYFSWLSSKKGFNVKFIELSAKINRLRTNWIITKITKIINKLRAKNKKILILGISYKKNIEDTRESASVKIFEGLKSKNYEVDYCDPFFKKYKFKIKKRNYLIKSIKFSKNIFKRYNSIIIATDHDQFNYKQLLQSKKIVIDLRGRFKNYKKENIISI